LHMNYNFINLNKKFYESYIFIYFHTLFYLFYRKIFKKFYINIYIAKICNFENMILNPLFYNNEKYNFGVYLKRLTLIKKKKN